MKLTLTLTLAQVKYLAGGSVANVMDQAIVTEAKKAVSRFDAKVRDARFLLTQLDEEANEG